MDVVGAAQSPAIVEWFAVYGQVTVYIVQMIYWLLVAGAAVFAAYQFMRLVNVKVAKTQKKHAEKGVEPASEPDDGIDVGQFVD